jgi:hypothetical protein
MNNKELRSKRHLESAVEYADSRGGKVLSEFVQRKKDEILWECAKSHQWTQSLENVVDRRRWCPVCVSNTPRTLAELQEVAVSRGGKVVSTEYINVDATYDFECCLGHPFSNTFSHVVRGGQWCPRCSKGSKSEEICRTTFEQIFEKKFTKVRPKWLRNSRGRQMEIDGYNEELGIGFEYQGIQHFTKDVFKSDLPQRILDDKRKVDLCQENGVLLFVIDYKMEYEDFPGEIRKQAIDLGIDVDKWGFNKKIDLSLAYIRNDRLQELTNLLQPKKIKVLSTKWIAVDTHYDFECKICGHIWSARGNHFFNSRRVGGCKKCAMKLLAGANRLDLAEVQEHAIKFGGRCLSESYGEIKQKYRFICKNGHEFEDIFNNMKFRNTFCPVCEGRMVKRYLTDVEALEILTINNLKPTAPRPKLLSQGWPAVCLVCGELVSTSLQHLLQRASPCKFCSGFAISEKKVRAVFENANLEPLVPFVSSSTPWKSQCKICQSIVNGRYGNLISGQGGCRTCSARKRSKS